MNSSRILVVMLLLVVAAALPGQSLAGSPETMAEGGEAKETASPPRSPLRVSAVDFQDIGEGSGKLTLAGIALPGQELHLFFDDAPLATVMPDGSGKWNLEKEMKLEDGRHTVRADQYVEGTEVLAARAIVTLQRVAPKSGEAPAPKATSP